MVSQTVFESKHILGLQPNPVPIYLFMLRLADATLLSQVAKANELLLDNTKESVAVPS